MEKGHLLARLHLGNHIEPLKQHRDKNTLMVLLSTKLEQECRGTFGDIYDILQQKVVYRCTRSAY